MPSENVIGAFSEEQASRISGLSVFQLRQWDKDGFFQAAYRDERPRVPYGRIYSFRDLVSLQVLDDLRNRKRIPLGHLKVVSRKLAYLGDARWTATTLYVLGKRVVLEHPETKAREDVVSGQQVFNIPLRVVIRNTRERIKALGERSDRVGKFRSQRFVNHGELVFDGTRVPVQTVADFLKSGYSTAEILREFPAIGQEDIEAVRRQPGFVAAA